MMKIIRFSGVAMLLLSSSFSHYAQDAQKDKFLARRAKRAAEVPAERANAEPRAFVTGILNLVSSKSWADSSGDYVLVGEVRNISSSAVRNARITLTFMNGSTVVGSDYDFIDGSTSARVGSSNSVSEILPPNEIGFFKLFTDFKAANITSFTYTSEGDSVASYTPGLAKPTLLGSFLLEARSFPEVKGTIKNTGTATAYLVQIHMAGYLKGSINDYDYAFAYGIGSTCDSFADDGIPPGSIGTFRDTSSREIDSIGRYAITFYECPVSTDPTLDLALNKYTYVTGDSVSTTDFRIRNPGSKSRAVEIKLFLVYPEAGPVNMLSLGADGSFKLPPNLDQSIGSITLMTITSGMTRGTYEFSSRVIDPATGKQISENINIFEVK